MERVQDIVLGLVFYNESSDELLLESIDATRETGNDSLYDDFFLEEYSLMLKRVTKSYLKKVKSHIDSGYVCIGVL